MVERQPARRAAAVDAAPAVSREQRTPGDLSLHSPRHADVRDQTDHMRPGIGVRSRVQRLVELLDHLGLALEHEHMRAPNAGDVQRLVARIQDENLLHLAENLAKNSP